MISHYKYCGYTTDNRYGNIKIWGAVIWIDSYGYTETVMFWGSSKAPTIRRYIHSSFKSKKETLGYKIKDKRSDYSRYTELVDNEIKEKLPELDSQIGMYMLMRKLKSV